jgi:hypothetical protein
MHRAAWMSLLAAGIAAAGWPREAEACGGFFCSQVPVDQSGERIVFTVDNGRVEAHVQIQYVGEAQDFAWIVPVHGVPTLSVGAPAFFTYVAQVTQPQFRLTWEDSCNSKRGFFFGDDAVMPTAGAADAGTGVEVIQQSQVGPYDSAILAATDATALKTWLTSNGYDIGQNAEGAIEPYVGQGYNFVALKLQKDRSVGELRPIVLAFEGTRPCVPIRLTAVAAQPNMPIVAYVFAAARAVPMNYRHVLINETRIDWLSSGANYNQIASRAVDEAGGQAFLTEFAGSTTPFANPMDWQLPGNTFNTALLATKTHPVDFVLEVFRQNFPRGDGALFAMFQRYIPLPQSLQGNVSPQQFYNDIAFYRSEIDGDPGRPPFDAVAFANELEGTIVAPLRRAHEILATYPYLTRLFTTMSAEEMTVDPEFDFNASAADVSNIHTATARPLCDADNNVNLTLSDGRSFTVSFGNGPVSAGPNAERIEQYTEVGPPATIKDNAATINAVIARDYSIGVPGSCGCGGAAAAVAPLAGLALVALGVLGRRRRRS